MLEGSPSKSGTNYLPTLLARTLRLIALFIDTHLIHLIILSDELQENGGDCKI